MIEEIIPCIYRIEVPLPHSPLKALNSYVIKGDGRYLVIDTGMNRPECQEAMTNGLKELNVDLDKADFFITHLHADHSGLCKTLAGPSSKIFMGHRDIAIQSEMTSEGHGGIRDFFFLNGFPEPELSKALTQHPGRRFGLKGPVTFNSVQEGDQISIGDYSFVCVETPGHTPGHTCLYDARKKLLLCGDHILIDITPNIMYWPELDNALQHYLDSLDKVARLDVNLLLPGHRRRFTDHRTRITELHKHHDARASEILAALQSGDKNVFQIAPYVTWDIDCASWESFPTQQKWFAFGETLSHLEYLETHGKVRRITRDGRITFALA